VRSQNTFQRPSSQKEPLGGDPSRARRERLGYVLALLLLQAGYAIGVLTWPNHFYGFNQLRYGGPLVLLAVVAAAWGAARLSLPGLRESLKRSGPLLRVLLPLGAATAFFLLRSHSPNPDGVAITEKMPQAVAQHGSFVTHDEMLEFLVHSQVFAAAHRLWGWSVELCYQVPAAVAGATFVLLLLVVARPLAEQHQSEFVALALCGGYVQLFFGDVENYSLVTVPILTYLVLSWWYLEGRVELWIPALALSLAICFHLVAGWLLPSLVFLVVHAQRLSRPMHVRMFLTALILPIALVLLYLHFHGLPIQRLFDSSHVSGMGGHYDRYLPPLRARYIGGMVNTVALLFPPIFLLPVLAFLGNLGSDPYSRFLQIASGTTLLMTFLWRAQLGVYEDWNLYAPGMIPVALLIAHRLTAAPGAMHQGGVRRALLVTGYSHSLLWVLSNHFRWGGNP
jgi:hypothetical protein